SDFRVSAEEVASYRAGSATSVRAELLAVLAYDHEVDAGWLLTGENTVTIQAVGHRAVEALHSIIETANDTLQYLEMDRETAEDDLGELRSMGRLVDMEADGEE